MRAASIRVRLILVFSVLLLLLLGVTGLAAWRLNELNRLTVASLRTDQAVAMTAPVLASSTRINRKEI